MRTYRDPWNENDNPHQTLAVAVRVAMEDAPEEAKRWIEWERDLADLISYLDPEEIHGLIEEIQRYKDQTLCERCHQPNETRYRYNGKLYCGSCRGELAARERWGYGKS